MEKFIFKKNGKEVKIGDSIIFTEVVDTYFGKIDVEREIIVDLLTIPLLLKEGIIVPLKEDVKKDTYEVPSNINFYVYKISKRMNWHNKKTANYLDSIYSLCPIACLSIFLKEIAIELDKKYSDHISKSPEIYVLSAGNGKITKVNKDNIKSYRNFAAFRTVEDAMFAYNIVKPLMEEMFENTSGE